MCGVREDLWQPRISKRSGASTWAAALGAVRDRTGPVRGRDVRTLSPRGWRSAGFDTTRMDNGLLDVLFRWVSFHNSRLPSGLSESQSIASLAPRTAAEFQCCHFI